MTTIDGATKRYRAKRDAILAAAAEAINEASAKGMTFADVARRVGLNTTSVTYYFKRKEDLAAAAFDHTLEWLQGALDESLEASTPHARVAKFLAIHFDRQRRIEAGEEHSVAMLSDLRAMEDPFKARLLAGWREVFRKTRTLWGEPRDRIAKDIQGARAHMLLENCFWLTVWLDRYEPDQYDRIEARLMDVFTHGLAGPGQHWSPQPLLLEQADTEPARDAFLRAATRLINELGYRGASVQRIASELNVTKGSFYHHLDAKDDLVAACYQRSFDTISAAQRAADRDGGNHWQRLSSTLAMLVDAQFTEQRPLLRTTALAGLPGGVRQAMVDRSNRIARRFAGTISDGIAEGSVRAVDPLIAAQALMALQNAAFDMRNWAATMPCDRAVGFYASTIMTGLFADPVV